MENKYFTDIMGDISFLKTSSFIKKVKNNNIDFIFYKRSKKENVDTINFILNLEKMPENVVNTIIRNLCSKNKSLNTTKKE